ncbi:DnaJ domain containing protein [Sesbania bispinosa]|nr:DnaJ domain containing protein [Sesbania bispinosa]
MNASNKVEAERLLDMGEKMLQTQDLKTSRQLAILAQEVEPLHEGSDQLLAILDVLEAAEKCVNDNTLDWYSILQVGRGTNDLDLIKKQYRRFAIILQPNRNLFSFAHEALKLVSEAWAVLSDPAQKSIYDKAFGRTSGESGDDTSTFWTACPYCYRLYEYLRVYEDCCLKCQNCERSFHGLSIPVLPPMVPGREAYYCTWGFPPTGSGSKKLESIGNAGEPGPMPAVQSNEVASVCSAEARKATEGGLSLPCVSLRAIEI